MKVISAGENHELCRETFAEDGHVAFGEQERVLFVGRGLNLVLVEESRCPGSSRTHDTTL